MNKGTKRFSPVSSYKGIVREHYEWSGRGPRRAHIEVCDFITGKGVAPRAAFTGHRLSSWDEELPPVGKPVEVFAKFVAEIYNGDLKDELQMLSFRERDLPTSHADVPMREGRGGGGMGPTASQVREQQPPPPTDRDEWGF